jgi:hypothetical protein
MFDKIFRSWEFAKLSYALLLQNTSLLIFPVISSIMVVIVTATFFLPLWGFGYFQWVKAHVGDDPDVKLVSILIAFMFYLVAYTVIFFFNTALTACALKALASEEVSVGDGIGMAMQRMPQILGWAAVSAVVGVLLQLIENSHQKAGQIISSILGTAWSVVTFFVVPVIVVEGLGPYGAFKRSASILTETWGEGLAGHFSLGLINFLISLPIMLLSAVIIFAGIATGSLVVIIVAIAVAGIMFATYCAASSAASVIFTAILYNYATGSTLPANVDKSALEGAFVQK